MQKKFAGASAETLLKFAAKEFAGRCVFATSLSAEDQVITHVIAREKLDIPLVTLDTGRLFQ